ncbi:MAG: DsbA family protein [Beijerinckiaceae bacterium]
MSETDKPRLIYFADTMCSWCYGFAPEMNSVLLEMGEEIDLILQAGGLRPFNTEVLTDEMKPRFRGYREQVQAASNQPFDWSFFEREGYVMDTEPASRAVVTMRALSVGSAYAYMHAIQRAYFSLNEDIRDTDLLAAYAGQFEVSPDEFKAAFESDAMKQATLADFQLAQRFQINGFPALVLLKGKGAYQISNGYMKADDVVANLRRALAHVAGTP